jgi:hypothetical protein
VNPTLRATATPRTVSNPEPGLTVYPTTDPTVNEYVPLGSENPIVDVVEVSCEPFRVTDHEVPDGRPLSVNVTVYSVGGVFVKLIDKLTDESFTVTLPELGTAV